MSYNVIFKVNPRNHSVFNFYAVNNRKEAMQIAIIQFPHDNMLGENMRTAEEIKLALSKRIRKSV